MLLIPAALLVVYCGSYGLLHYDYPPGFIAVWRGKWVVAIHSDTPTWTWDFYAPCRYVEESWRNW